MSSLKARQLIHTLLLGRTVSNEGETPDQELIETAARAVHEANRAFCEDQGDFSQVPWDHALDEMRSVTRAGVVAVLDGTGPEELHAIWCRNKEAQGWTYGAVKDPAAKTHPSLVPYAELSTVEQAKDTLFHQTVHDVQRQFAIA